MCIQITDGHLIYLLDTNKIFIKLFSLAWCIPDTEIKMSFRRLNETSVKSANHLKV